MMKKILLLLWITVYTPAGYSTPTDLTLSPAAITYSNPVDAVTDFNLLTGSWNATGQELRMCNPGSGGNLTKSVIVSSSLSSGYQTSIDGSTYTIFSSEMAGIGWIMGARDNGTQIWTPLTNSETTVYPFAGGGTGGSTSFGANIRFAFVKLPGNLPIGVNTFPNQKIADFRCYRNTSLIETAKILVNTTNINVQALACEVTSNKTVSVLLGTFSKAELPSVGSNFGGASTIVNLSCDSGVIPWMTLSDASDPSNVSNIIKLSPDSTAEGIGVQAFYDDEPTAKLLGLDSSSKGNPNQFQIGNKTSSNGQVITVPLSFKYIRMQETVKAGDANAVATVTFSYQ
ncbi:fimbrial protein [Morganella morganii]|nr:fimbrial protein [Morganella morganii]